MSTDATTVDTPRTDNPRTDDTLDEDRLPWLEAVEEEERGPSPGKLIAAVLIGLVVIGIIVGGLFWLGSRASGGGAGKEELIASPGDYKMPAPEPGGMQVSNQGSTQVAASEGAEPKSTINPNARPEAPVTQPQAQVPAQARPQQQPQQPAQQRPAPAQQAQAPGQQQRPQQQQPQQQAAAQPRLQGPTIQVGAYPSAEAANGEWNRLTQRFPFLRSLQHGVMVHQRGGQTFYRLRAAGNQAPDVCRRLRSAGQPCMDVRN